MERAEYEMAKKQAERDELKELTRQVERKILVEQIEQQVEEELAQEARRKREERRRRRHSDPGPYLLFLPVVGFLIIAMLVVVTISTHGHEQESYWYEWCDLTVKQHTGLTVGRNKFFDFYGYLKHIGATGVELRQRDYVHGRIASEIHKADMLELDFQLGRYDCAIVAGPTDHGPITYLVLEADGVQYFSSIWGGYDLVRDPYGPMVMLRGALVRFQQLVERADFSLATTPFEQCEMDYSAWIEGTMLGFRFGRMDYEEVPVGSIVPDEAESAEDAGGVDGSGQPEA